MGRKRPEDYVAAISRALVLYRDEDVKDGLALIDNWGLMHALFAFSSCLERNDRAWRVAAGRSLAELAPAPRFAALWQRSPRVLVDLLIQARCRPVRSWAVGMVRRDLAAVLPVFPLEERLGPLVHDDTGPPQDWSNPSLWRLGPWERDPGPTGAADPIPVPSGAILSEVIPAPRPGIAGGVEIRCNKGR